MPKGFIRSGTENTVNTFSTLNQLYSDVAALKGGGYVVTWMSDQQDGHTAGIFSQRFSAKGDPLGAELQVNTFFDGVQTFPAVTGLKNGGYVIVWQSSSPSDSPDVEPVYGQMYTAKGKPAGGEFMVNSTTANFQKQPDVTGLKDGGFVVTWSSLKLDFQGVDIFSQRYDASGTKVGGETPVNTTVYSTQNNSSTTALNNGGYVVTWESFGQDGSGYGVFGRVFKGDGSAKTAEFQVTAFTSNNQDDAQVTALSNGGFVVAWVSDGQDGSNKGIFVQTFNASGIAKGTETQVNTFTAAHQFNPVVTSFDDGGFVVVWQSNNQDGSPVSVFGQRFDAKSNPIGGEVAINIEPGFHQDSPAVTTLADGSFVVTWSSSTPNVTDGVDVHAQIYSAQSFGTGAKNKLIGDANANWIDGLGNNDKIFGLAGADELYGNQGNDVVVGGKGRDLLFGGKGADVLKGGVGNDRLVGGVGKDKLFGNAGGDKFIFKSKSDSTTSKGDQIMDFEKGVDDIVLAKVIAGDFSYIGNGAFTGTASEVQVTKNTVGDSIVRVDVDGDGTVDMRIDVIGVTGLMADDFIL